MVFLYDLRWLVFLLLLLLGSFLVLYGFPLRVWSVLRVILRLLLIFVSSVLVGPGVAVPSEASCPFPCLGAGCLACSWGGSVGWGFVCEGRGSSSSCSRGLSSYAWRASVWASIVVAHAILSLGLHVSAFV